MRARPGRLLPSVIVGGLLASGLALGAGTASAADADSAHCYIGTTLYKILDADKVSKDGNDCKVNGSILSSLTGIATGLLEPATTVADGATSTPSGGSTTPGAAGGDATANNPTTGTPSGAGAGNDSTSGTDTKAGTGNGTASGNGTATGNGTGTKPAPAVVAPAPAPVGAPAPLGAAGPVGALPALPPLGGIAPAGLATNLFAANSYDPGLLFGSPLGNAASALFSPKADSDVTTVSQAQVLPTAASSGYGTPATIGVIILACLIGFAVRHRVISRMKAREVPAEEYRPRHAAPELADADSEVAGEPVPDDARTLVVLTQR
ncbi:hypothetical protein GCM10023201_05670 [Actinomycetospora corticicola]|uniref:Uncharacterized protein n=1 Tax=Actinomycetospora corticicola TaxID=663602 RepID=A0A7Y9DSV7_9PSEU|nr:hypothetical protein [Actinomycetospora corticicola]NYD34785.1 hypothetical protein [Actinomycetospora corticicola]